MLVTDDPSDAQIAALERGSARRETPCGAGRMVWRRWGEGRPVILLHGGSGSWLHWFRTIPALSGAGYEVWAADLPGLGDSDMPGDPPTPRTSGAAVAGGIEQLFPDGRTPDLVGFSFGAHVGTAAAVLLGRKIRTFTLSGSAALGLPHTRLDFAKERIGMSEAERDAVHRANLEMLMFADPRRIDPLAVRIQSLNIAKARFRSRVFAPTDEIRRMLPEVAVPVRALWGELDNIADGDVAARLDLIRALRPEMLSRTIPGAGHWAAYEAADAFNAALMELLQAPV